MLNDPRLGELQVEEGEQGARHRPRALRPRRVLPVGQVQGRIRIAGFFFCKAWQAAKDIECAIKLKYAAHSMTLEVQFMQ